MHAFKLNLPHSPTVIGLSIINPLHFARMAEFVIEGHGNAASNGAFAVLFDSAVELYFVARAQMSQIFDLFARVEPNMAAHCFAVDVDYIYEQHRHFLDAFPAL